MSETLVGILGLLTIVAIVVTLFKSKTQPAVAFIVWPTILALILVIRFLQDGAETGKILRFLGRTALSLLCSCIFYKLIWDLSLKLCHVEASTYRGGGDVSALKILTSLPASIKSTYLDFYRYFFENELKHNVYQRLALFRLMLICLIIVTVILIWRKLGSRSPGAKIGAAACVLLMFNWDENTWNDIGNREEVKTMPVYPDEGYVRRIGNAMVVRLS